MLRFLAILALVVSVVRLFAAGLLTPGYVLIALLCGVALMAFGPKLSIATIAIGGLILLSRELGGAHTDAMMAHILAIAMVLFALYLMLRALFRRGA